MKSIGSDSRLSSIAFSSLQAKAQALRFLSIGSPGSRFSSLCSSLFIKGPNPAHLRPIYATPIKFIKNFLLKTLYSNMQTKKILPQYFPRNLTSKFKFWKFISPKEVIELGLKFSTKISDETRFMKYINFKVIQGQKVPYRPIK
jgi:hypothetical protein